MRLLASGETFKHPIMMCVVQADAIMDRLLDENGWLDDNIVNFCVGLVGDAVADPDIHTPRRVLVRSSFAYTYFYDCARQRRPPNLDRDFKTGKLQVRNVRVAHPLTDLGHTYVIIIDVYHFC